MSLTIYFTPRSKETLELVYNFIANKFSNRAAQKFLSKAEKTISLIAEQPFMFRSSEIDKNVRIAFITKQCSLFYQVTNDSINLLFFWDNRQDPI